MLLSACTVASGLNRPYMKKLYPVCDQPPMSTQRDGHPFVDRRIEYQPKGWGVKAGMVRVWVAGKTL